MFCSCRESQDVGLSLGSQLAEEKKCQPANVEERTIHPRQPHTLRKAMPSPFLAIWANTTEFFAAA
jgi:hypothetical protein